MEIGTLFVNYFGGILSSWNFEYITGLITLQSKNFDPHAKKYFFSLTVMRKQIKCKFPATKRKKLCLTHLKSKAILFFKLIEFLANQYVADKNKIVINVQ